MLAGLTVAAAPARADEGQSAESLFQAGMSDMQNKRFASACPALRKSYKIEPRPATLFYLAECEQGAGRIATAAATYDEYLERFDRLSATEQKQEADRENLASSRREALEKDLPFVRLTIPASAPDGTRVSRVPQGGGEPVAVALNVPLPLDPGEHVVSTEAPGRPRLDKRFFIQKGERKAIMLELAPPTVESAKQVRFGTPLAPVPSYLPPLNPGISGRRVMAYTLGGIGVAGVLVGAVTGAVTWAQKRPIDENCNDLKICNPAGESAKSTAKTMGIVSTASFIVGAAGLATGLVLYFTEPPPPKFSLSPQRVIVGVNRVAPASTSMELTWTF
ncbi:MAG: hypothetical protein U0359_26290 [Byssovorax sp.]